MATLLDVVGLFKALGLYETVFPAILIFAFVYGILYKFQPFGDNKAINSVVALVIALIFVSFIKAVTFISFLIPIVTALVVILLLILIIFMFMGVPAETIQEAMKNPAVYGLLIILIVIFVFVGLAATFPEVSEKGSSLAGQTGTTSLTNIAFASFSQIMFHPLIIGTIILLVIFAVATYFITRPEKK